VVWDRLDLVGCACVAIVLCTAAPAAALPVQFTEPAHQGTDQTPVSIATGDFDGDGDIDLATANMDTDDVSVLRGTAAGSFGGLVNTLVGNEPRAVAAGRFDGGSDLDLATANFAADTVSVLTGGADTSFTKLATDITVGNGPRAIAIGLFDGGTDPDLAIANEHSDDVSVLLAAGTTGATFLPAVSFSAGVPPQGVSGLSPSGIAAGDFNGDGRTDLAVANLQTDDVGVLVGGSNPRFAAPAQYAAGNGPRAIVTADFNGDGDLDLAVANENTDDVSILRGGVGASFSAPDDFGAGDAPRGVATADFTRDGDLDLVVANTQSDNVSVLVGGAGAGFSAPLQLGAGDGPWAVATGDFNADGEEDFVVSNTGSEDVSRMLNITPPDTVIASGPTGASNDPTPSFELGADEPGTSFECRVDDAAFAACGQTFTTTLADGPRVVEARATDPAGNTDPTPASRAVTIDTVAPDTRIDAGVAGLSRDPVQAFAFSSGEPGSSFECRVDGAAFAACSAPFSTPPLPDGGHVFEVRAVDPAGNADQTAAARAFTIDATPPDTTIASGPAGRTTVLQPAFGFASSETGSTFECSVDAGAFAPCGSPFTVRPRARGPHVFEARAKDLAGNVDPSPARRSFRTLLRIRSRITHVWRSGLRATTVVRLVVKGVPAGARVGLRCRGPGCPFGRTQVAPDRRRRARATGRFRGASLGPGAVVEVRVTASHAIGKVARFRIRPGAVPGHVELCLAPGARRPVRCAKVLKSA
jgi:hypothetical protein